MALEPFFLFEVNEADDDDEETDDDNYRVGDRRFEFWHVGEVHAIPADDEGKRHEDGGDDSEDGDNMVLFDI